MAIEIVDLPNLKMVIFHSYVNVYQRVNVSIIGLFYKYTITTITILYYHLITIVETSL